jgi:MerR family transcriptional regulator, thiopeptide resistance regulator
MDGLTVSQVSKLAGVSVRTLHHYDEIGLLRPSGRSGGGYRLYGQGELQRLQQVLFFKELGFPLDEISKIMRDRAFDLHAALLLQRQLLEEKAVRVRALIGAVDAALQSIEKGTTMSKEEMFEVFGEFDPSKYEEEAKEKWGEADAYKESKRRTARYGKKEWQQIKAEGEALAQQFVALMDAGVKPTDKRAMEVAEKHRQHISKWFYTCTYEIHRGLAEMYVADQRFTANIDRVKTGLAAFQREAILANASRAARQ